MSGARFYVTTPIPEPALTLLRAAGSVEVPEELPDAARLREVCVSGDYDVVVSQLRDTFDADLLAAAKIRGISNYAVGFNNVDIGAATANKILVGNTPGVLTDATADVAMLLIMATARRAVEADTFVRSGKFTGWEPNLLLGQDVSGSTLGLAGFGRIARATAAGHWPSACRCCSARGLPATGRCRTPNSASSPDSSPTPTGTPSSPPATSCPCMFR